MLFRPVYLAPVQLSHKPAAAAPPYSWEIVDLFRNEGIKKFREVYAKHWTPGSPPIAEKILNSVGYNLLAEGMNDRALEAFAMNVELFPRSANALDSLSEAYETIGDKEKSFQNAQKALALLPTDSSLDESMRQSLKGNLEQRIKRLKN